jgi:uncharacterized protein
LRPDFFNIMNFIWFDHLFFCVVGILLPIMSVMAEKPNADDQDIDIYKPSLPPKKHIYYTNGLMLCIGAMIVLTLWNLTLRPFDVLGVNYPTIDALVIGLCSVIVIIYSIDTFINYTNSKKSLDDIKELSHIMPTSWNDFKHFIFLAFAAGICEEIVFRGFLVNYISHLCAGSEYGYFLALVLPAVIFSISHVYQGWFAVMKIFAISLLFGAIFIFSKSLLLVCIIHVLVDLISGAVMVKVFTDANKSINSGQ